MTNGSIRTHVHRDPCHSPMVATPFSNLLPDSAQLYSYSGARIPAKAAAILGLAPLQPDIVLPGAHSTRRHHHSCAKSKGLLTDPSDRLKTAKGPLGCVEALSAAGVESSGLRRDRDRRSDRHNRDITVLTICGSRSHHTEWSGPD